MLMLNLTPPNNGFTGFIPFSRMENQKLILAIEEDDNLGKLIRSNGLTHVVVHENWFNGCNGEGLMTFLAGHPQLKAKSADNGKVIYQVLTP